MSIPNPQSEGGFFALPRKEKSPAEKAAEAKKEAENRERASSFTKERDARLKSINEREAELRHMRERLMCNHLSQAAQLPMGEDTNEALTTVKACKELETLIAFCQLRRAELDKSLKQRFDNGGWGLSAFIESNTKKEDAG